MTGTDKETTPKQIDWVKAPDGIIEVYANTAHMTWSLDDVRVRFAQLVDSPKTPNPGDEFIAVAEERASVTFAWRNAVVFRDGLSKLIEAYEKTNGPIKMDVKLPPSM
jgi:hypothetical protein